MSLSAILACLSSELATRRLAHLRPHLQSHTPRPHSSTRLDRTHRVVCESSLLLGLLFGLSALGRRFSRALVFNELVARPRADPRVFFHTLLHVRLLARNFTCCACSAGCFTSTTLSLRALRVGSRSFQSCGCWLWLVTPLCHSWSALGEGQSDIVLRCPSSSRPGAIPPVHWSCAMLVNSTTLPLSLPQLFPLGLRFASLLQALTFLKKFRDRCIKKNKSMKAQKIQKIRLLSGAGCLTCLKKREAQRKDVGVVV